MKTKVWVEFEIDSTMESGVKNGIENIIKSAFTWGFGYVVNATGKTEIRKELTPNDGADSLAFD